MSAETEAPHPSTPESLYAQRPVEVSMYAREQLDAWGITEDEQNELVAHTGEYDYAAGAAKIERIVAGGALVDRETNNVVIPSMLEYAGARKDGQCGDISAKVYGDLYNNGWIHNVNAHREAAGKPPLELTYTTGNSRTYFSRPGDSSHIWVNMREQGAPIQDSLILDGSFRTISVAAESGYRIQDLQQLISVAEFKHASFTPAQAVVEADGTARYDFEGCTETVLGATESSNRIISLLFIDDKGKMVPALSAADEAGGAITYLVSTEHSTSPDGLLMLARGSNNISTADHQEMLALLTKLQQLELVDTSAEMIADAMQPGPAHSIVHTQ